MNTILRSPENSHFSVADHLGFHQSSFAICTEYATAIDDSALLADYQAKIAMEEANYNWVLRNEYTEKKAEADHRRDFLLTGIYETVRGNLKHFDPPMRDRAIHLNNLFANYGDPRRVGYDAESVAIDGLITHLLGDDYLPDVQALSLVSAVDALEAQNNYFKTLADDASAEQMAKPDVSPVNSRKATNAALKKITNRVLSLITLNGMTGFVEFVDKFNNLVNRYNTIVHEHYGRLHARVDITPATIDTIGDQPYTGKPVNVIPTLNLVVRGIDGSSAVVELVFSVDFNVTYKDNVQPGTATLFIHGIGRYAGERVTTFNIVRL
ncbi:MAG: DUF6261 family protein [Prevotellaceae bacterium]|jgi:hypothetical protein|nr:DUF6261 family protein [Prevotellaceae bacterium]